MFNLILPCYNTFMITDSDKIETVLTHTIAKIYPSKEALIQKLKSGEQLTFYLGIDPTIPDVHLGHAVVYKKLEELRQMGHKVIFLIGDFTARIGDPTDQSSARVQLTGEEVTENARLYKEQISKVLQFDDPLNPAEMKFNSEWLAPLTFEDLIELSANFTLQQMIERDMFQERLTENKPVYMHEFFYPLMQGYDSVVMNVDVEIGGTDQTFNMLSGRDLMKKLRDKEKFVITCEFLMGLDGNKMSKSKGNFISLREEPFEMYRKIMTLHDNLIEHYYDMIFADWTPEIALKAKDDPMQAKKDLAFRIVEWLFDEDSSKEAADTFARLVQQDEIPSEIPQITLTSSVSLVDFLVEHAAITSKSDARRLIQQGGVRINEEKITDITYEVRPEDSIIKIGKGTFIRVVN